MADGGIGHQPLEVALADRREGTQRHRGDGDEDDDLLPVGRRRLEGFQHHAQDQRHRRHFRRHREEGRHRRRGALVDVRRPHVERHRRDLEGQAGQDEDQPEDQAELASGAADGGGDLPEIDAAGIAVGQRDAVEHHAGAQRAEHEVFQAGLAGTGILAIDGGNDIEGQRLQFEAEIERNHAVGRDHQHHAQRRKHDQHGIFVIVVALRPRITDRHHQRHRGAEQRHQFHEPGEIVLLEGAVEGGTLPAGKPHPETGAGDDTDSEAVDQSAGVFARIGARHQQGERADRQDQFRRRERKAGKEVQ